MLRGASSPCPADKAPTPCLAEDLVCRARNVLIPFAPSACWAGRNVILLPLPFYQHTITPWICSCLGFCLRNPDANPSDPRSELLLILGHLARLSYKLIPVMATRGICVWGEKKSSSSLSVVMSVCVGRVELAGSLTVLL